MQSNNPLNAAISAFRSGVSLDSIEGIARVTPEPTSADRLQFIAHSALVVRQHTATKQQCELLDKLVTRKRIPYSYVMAMCSQASGRKIRTFGEMYSEHIESVIQEVKVMQYRDIIGKEYKR